MLSFMQMAAALTGQKSGEGSDESAVKVSEEVNKEDDQVADPPSSSLEEEGTPSEDAVDTSHFTGDTSDSERENTAQNTEIYAEGPLINELQTGSLLDIDTVPASQEVTEEEVSSQQGKYFASLPSGGAGKGLGFEGDTIITDETSEGKATEEVLDITDIVTQEQKSTGVNVEDLEYEGLKDEERVLEGRATPEKETGGSVTVTVTEITLETVERAAPSLERLDADIVSLEVDKMPGVQDEEERSVSPSLMFATCRYRWAKTVVTQSDKVVFVTLNKKVDPIRLDWDDTSQCFYSDELRMATGNYIGNLVIDGQFYPVEDVHIKHYTFEVDLYLKDDIIEDEVDKKGLTKAEDLYEKEKQQKDGVDTYRDINADYIGSGGSRMEEKSHTEQTINLTSKYQELVRSQMSHTMTDFDGNCGGEAELSPPKTDLLDMDTGRRSPVGDDGRDVYQDQGEPLLKNLGHVYQEEPLPGPSSLNRSLVEDDVEQKESVHSSNRGTPLHGSDRGTPPSSVEDVINSAPRMPIYSTNSPVHSKNSSAHSSARHTPVVNDSHLDFKQQPSRESVNLSPVQTFTGFDQSNPDVFNGQTPPRSLENSQHCASPQTPPREQIDDVLNPADRHSPIRRDYLMTTPPNSLHSSTHNSAQGSNRQTPQKEFITDSLKASAEKLYGQKDFRRSSGDYMNSNGGSSLGSRPQSSQSLTSEQELTQYYEQFDTKRTPATGAGQTLPSLSGTNGTIQRAGSASSLPAIGSQQRHSTEKRSMTPDNHIRVPGSGIVRGPLLPNRTSPRTPASNTSSRTVTPVNAVTIDTKSEEKIKELEETVSNQRKRLTDKEQEILDLTSRLRDVQDVNQSLQEELDHRRANSPGPQLAEWERKYNLLMDEKEILAGEIVKLQDDLDRQKNETPSLSSYDPNNPYALQRKISDLKSQIQDLQEANESAVDEINAAENKIKDLVTETESHRAAHASKLRELEEENRQLRHEVTRAKEQQQTYSYSDASEHRLRIELQQVKEDNRGLRERNYTLHDDNLKLREELASLRKSLEVMEVNKKTFKDEKLSRSALTYERSVIEKDKSLDGSYHSDRGGVRDYSATTDLLERDSLDRRRDREKDEDREKDMKRYRYGTARYETRTEKQALERTYEKELFSKTDSAARYSSYRTVPDGRVTEKPRSAPLYDRSVTPERPSALGPPTPERAHGSSSLDRSKQDRLDRDGDRYRHARSRTVSGERDLKSLPMTSAYTDMGKTVPALPERSRAIFKSLSDLRSRSRSRSPGNRSRQYREFSADITHQSEVASRPMPSKISTNRKVPIPKQSNRRADELPPRHTGLSERSDLMYNRPSQASHHRSPSNDSYREEKAYESRTPAVPSYQDEGEMSDTPTDILVSAQPIERIKTGSWGRTRQRRGSAGSEGSGSSISDIDEPMTTTVRKRSKSADNREILRRMAPTGGTNRSGPSTPVKTGDRNAGFRSITPRPMATQHNKTSLSLSTGMTSLTQGLRPYAPRSPADIQVSDVIKFSRQGGKLSQGTVKFIGHLPGRGDVYLGVELDKEDGKHDGTFEGIRYFKCKPNKGVFVAYNKVVMAWTVN